MKNGCQSEGYIWRIILMNKKMIILMKMKSYQRKYYFWTWQNKLDAMKEDIYMKHKVFWILCFYSPQQFLKRSF